MSFDNDILKSLNNDEVERLLYSIKYTHTFYNSFKKGTPIKFDLHPDNPTVVRIHMYGSIGGEEKWTWCNSVSSDILAPERFNQSYFDFQQTYLSIIRDRKLNHLGV